MLRNHLNTKGRRVRRFLTSYLVVLLPLLMLSLAASRLVMHFAAEKERHRVERQLAVAAQNVDDLFVEYLGKGSIILDRHSLYPENILRDNASKREGLNELKNLSTLDRTSKNCFTYYGTGELFTQIGYVHLDVFCQVQLRCDEQTALLLEYELASRERWAMLVPSENGGSILFHVPALRGGIASVNFQVDYASLVSILPAMGADAHVGIRLTDGQGKNACFLLEDGRYQTVRPEELDRVCGEAYDVVQVEMPSTGFTAMMYYSRQMVTGVLRASQLWNYAILVLGVLISMLLSLWLSRNRAIHLGQLEAMFIEERLEFPRKKLPGDVYEPLRSLIRNSIDETSSSRTDAQNYRALLRRQIPAMLMQGMFSSREEFNQTGSLCGFELQEEFFCILGILFASPEASQAFERCQQDGMYVVRSLHEKPVLLLLTELPNPDLNASFRTEQLCQMRDAMDELGMSAEDMFFSNVYADVEMAQYACQEVLGKVESSITGRTPSDGGEVSTALVCEDDTMRRLTEALASRNGEEAAALLEQVFRRIAHNGAGPESQRYQRYSLLEAVVHALHGDPSGDDLAQQAMQINPTDEHFEQQLLAIIDLHCNTAGQNHIRRAIEYIRANYRDSNLSAAALADYLGMSRNYLGRLFKNKLGMTYLEYVTKIRMTEAKRLLMETRLPIKAIVQKVGYIDDSSFRKKFKDVFGETVSDYRVAMTGEKTPEESESDEQ